MHLDVQRSGDTAVGLPRGDHRHIMLFKEEIGAIAFSLHVAAPLGVARLYAMLLGCESSVAINGDARVRGL